MLPPVTIRTIGAVDVVELRDGSEPGAGGRLGADAGRVERSHGPRRSPAPRPAASGRPSSFSTSTAYGIATRTASPSAIVAQPSLATGRARLPRERHHRRLLRDDADAKRGRRARPERRGRCLRASAPFPVGTTTAAGGRSSWSTTSSAIDAVRLVLDRLRAVLEERQLLLARVGSCRRPWPRRRRRRRAGRRRRAARGARACFGSTRAGRRRRRPCPTRRCRPARRGAVVSRRRRDDAACASSR